MVVTSIEIKGRREKEKLELVDYNTSKQYIELLHIGLMI